MSRRASSPRRPGLQAGLSRPETLLVVGGILLVLSIVLPGWAFLRRRDRLAMVRADLSALIEASGRFYEEYGTWPASQGEETGDRRYGAALPNREVFNVLRALDAQGNVGHAVNTRRLVLFEAASFQRGLSGFNAEGDLLDPWGRPYQLVLDLDLNNVCEVPDSAYGRREGEGIMAWSCGPDGLSDNADDIRSWTTPNR